MGKWKDGKKHGKCTFTWSDEVKQKDSKFHGQGIYTFSEENKGVVEFKYNKPQNITTCDKYGNYK